MSFGQLVLGPAGSGKTTYCNGMLHYLTLSGAWCRAQRRRMTLSSSARQAAKLRW